ncbi:MAG: antibiotic biosynthesis monooxygenase family protein [Chloroflexota bacterium]
MAIHQTARFQVKKEALSECEAAIRKFVEYVRANEPKTLMYISLQQNNDPTRFLHYFIFEDEAARDRHANSLGTEHFTSVLYPNLLEPVEFTEYTQFSGT